MNSDRASAADRLSAVISQFKTKREAAIAAGVSTDQLARYEKGTSSPPLEVVTRLAVVTGVSLDWLATGRGPMRPGEGQRESPVQPAANVVVSGLDDDLFGELYAVISKLYRERGVRIEDRDFGALVSEKASEIAGASTDPAVRRTMIPLIVLQLDKDLRAGTGRTPKGKRSASEA